MRVHHLGRQKGLINAQRGLVEEVRFEFRRMMPEEREAYYVLCSKTPALKRLRAGAEQIARRIDSWTLKDEAGQPLPITVDTLMACCPAWLDRLTGIVLGEQASDLDDSILEQADGDLAEQAAAVLGGTLADQQLKN